MPSNVFSIGISIGICIPPQSICIVNLGKVCFTGRDFGAKEAKEVGLISKVCTYVCV